MYRPNDTLDGLKLWALQMLNYITLITLGLHYITIRKCQVQDSGCYESGGCGELESTRLESVCEVDFVVV